MTLKTLALPWRTLADMVVELQTWLPIMWRTLSLLKTTFKVAPSVEDFCQHGGQALNQVYAPLHGGLYHHNDDSESMPLYVEGFTIISDGSFLAFASVSCVVMSKWINYINICIATPDLIVLSWLNHVMDKMHISIPAYWYKKVKANKTNIFGHALMKEVDID